MEAKDKCQIPTTHGCENFSKENSRKPKFYCFLCSCLKIKQPAGIPLFGHMKICNSVANSFLKWIDNVLVGQNHWIKDFEVFLRSNDPSSGEVTPYLCYKNEIKTFNNVLSAPYRIL